MSRFSIDLPDTPWKAIGGIAKEDVEAIKDRYFDKRSIWASDDWQEKHESHDECEWCGADGSDNVIQLHHEGSRAYNPDWYDIWDDVAYSLFEEYGETYNASMDKGSELFVKHCVAFVRENRGFVAYRFKQTVEEYAREYVEQEELVPLCKACHYAWEQKRMRICGICNEEYAPRRDEDDVPDYTCWDCFSTERGLKECDCGGWFDPEKYNQCKECRGPF